MLSFLLLLFVLLVVFDLLALRWGYDSTESFNSPEWARRQQQAQKLLMVDSYATIVGR